MHIFRTFAVIFHLMAMVAVNAQQSAEMSADEIMAGVLENLRLENNIYEEISVILTDHAGYRDTRQMRKYTRITDDEVINFLLVFDEPEEYQGVALLVEQDGFNDPEVSIYLPANGQLLRHLTLWNDSEGIFGMDFTLGQITRVLNTEYRYLRRADRKIGNNSYYVIDVYAKDADISSALPLMQHQIRQDTMLITRTNYYDEHGKVEKQLSLHNLKLNSEERWSAAMQYMVNRTKRHSTLIKVDRRIISDDYVSDDVFTHNWLLENKPPLDISPSDVEQLETELIDASINELDESLVTGQLRGYQ